MKNKEIEELLDKLKDKDWYEELDLTGIKWIELKQEETNLLLSYIEQLEKENQQLKKQKDDVIEYLKKRITYDSLCNMEVETYISPKKILRMLGEIDNE